MEKSKNMKEDPIKAEVAEPKAEFTEDSDEAWLDDLLIHLNAIEEWHYKKNAAKVLMEDPMCKMHSHESHWNQIVFWYPMFLCYGAYGSDIYSLTEPKMDVPPQENTEPEAGSDNKEAVPALKNAATQTKGKTTRDAAIQVRMKSPLKNATPSGNRLANSK